MPEVPPLSLVTVTARAVRRAHRVAISAVTRKTANGVDTVLLTSVTATHALVHVCRSENITICAV